MTGTTRSYPRTADEAFRTADYASALTVTRRPFRRTLRYGVALAVLLPVALALLPGCGQKEVSFETLETARKQARENSEFNARAWRAQTPAYAQFALITRGDSSQTPECPQGDGWASIDLVDSNNPARKMSLKCSTVSDSVGCRESNDFKSSPYANEDGRCQPTTKVPHPLPKIAK